MRDVAAPDAPSVDRWLDAFAAAVRAADYARGADLFDPGVLGFGTVVERADGRERLLAGQWEKIWGVTRGFRFDPGARIEVLGDVAWVASTWSSTGFDAAGRPYPRVGRATIVLRRGGTGWLAVHSHVSLRPADAGAR
jgi:ketosteroid isomerase-like protein